MRYITKPFEIEAVQFTGDKSVVEESFQDIDLADDQDMFDNKPLVAVYDHLQDTWVRINHGDYIIRGMKGEYYPCDAEVFEAKYEELQWKS